MEMTIGKNPVLKGFNPDPSILRVKDDFYIATSTFEWFPGVQIHHSKDLLNWELVTRPLDRVSQLDMKGCGSSCGVWAPCLTYDGKLFYLVYTVVRSKDRWKDTHNYIVTSPSIQGPWSEPHYVNSYGFDPSLFHDDDGKKWVVTMNTDLRKGKNRFAGIILQRWDEEKGMSVGERELIWKGTDIGLTEGPHLYHIGKYYYLFCAEGGTSYCHAESVARSASIHGPYETMPGNPLVTSNVGADEKYDYGNKPYEKPSSLAIQKSGHASLIQLPDGGWMLAHLCGRPVGGRYCILGRETALENVVFDKDAWPRLKKGGMAASATYETPFDGSAPKPVSKDYDFSKGKLDIDFQTLRHPLGPDMLSFLDRKGYLRLYGREGLMSCFDQSLVGRRQQSFHVVFTTKLDFHPTWYKQMAGLAYYYNTQEFYYLALTFDDEMHSRVLRIFSCDNNVYDEWISPVQVPKDGEISLMLCVDQEKAQYRYSLDGKKYFDIGPVLDATKISDDRIAGSAFTGAFFALCCQDMSGFHLPADFRNAHYEELD
jgi:xylan 1,4-beta-xylosidase